MVAAEKPSRRAALLDADHAGCDARHIGLEGGGFSFGRADEGHIGSSGRRFAWPAVPKGANATGLSIPVARITDMLLDPGGAVDYDGKQITYPDIKLIYWAGGNPFHHHQDLSRLVRAWQRPDTVIVQRPQLSRRGRGIRW